LMIPRFLSGLSPAVVVRVMVGAPRGVLGGSARKSSRWSNTARSRKIWAIRMPGGFEGSTSYAARARLEFAAAVSAEVPGSSPLGSSSGSDTPAKMPSSKWCGA